MEIVRSRRGGAPASGPDRSEGAIDQEKIKQAVRLFLEAIGEDATREGLRDTPDRVARLYQEFLGAMHQDPAETLSATFHEAYDGVVIVRDLPFHSLCEHHLLPFFGRAHLAYIPGDGVVVGLSKLARLVTRVAQRPQLQERLTQTLAETVERRIGATGVIAYVEATHLCMTMRGAKALGSATVTVATRGTYATDPVQASAVLSLIRAGLGLHGAAIQPGT